jgi:hypothetical protein
MRKDLPVPDLYHRSQVSIKGVSSRIFSSIERTAPKDLSNFAKEIEKEIKALHEQIKLLSLGIDYRRYMRFQWLTPIVHLMMSGTYEVVGDGRGQSYQDYLFCYHFVYHLKNPGLIRW